MTAASDIEALDDLWSEIEDSYGTMAVDERLSRLLRSNSVSHRFATVTQIAGHYFDRGRNPLVMQSSAAEPGAWDARSYCSNVIVPWLRGHDSPLGTSPDPYVNNPLRRPLIVAAPAGVRPHTLQLWQALHGVLSETLRNPEKASEQLLQCLAILRRLVDEQDNPLTLPPLISPQSTLRITDEFLAVRSGGDRGLAIVWAAFEIFFKDALNLARVERAAINSADAASGRPGDVNCYAVNDELVLSVEVKERSLSLADATDSFAKLVYDQGFRLLFSVPALEHVDASAISAAAISQFKKGVTVHFAGPAELLRVGLLISEPESASLFLRAVEGSLTRYNNQPSNRQAWRDIVRDIIS